MMTETVVNILTTPVYTVQAFHYGVIAYRYDAELTTTDPKTNKVSKAMRGQVIASSHNEQMFAVGSSWTHSSDTYLIGRRVVDDEATALKICRLFNEGNAEDISAYHGMIKAAETLRQSIVDRAIAAVKV